MLWAARVLVLVAVVMWIPRALDPVSTGRGLAEIGNSIRALARLPLAQITGETEIRLKLVAPTDRIAGDLAQSRFIQVSIVRNGPTPAMVPWDEKGIGIAVFQNGKEVAISRCSVPFYLHSSDVHGPVGLAFTPQEGNEFEVVVQFHGVQGRWAGSDLVIAPNWPNPMLVKDRMVVEMISPLYNTITMWMSRVGILLAAIAALCLFLVRVQQR